MTSTRRQFLQAAAVATAGPAFIPQAMANAFNLKQFASEVAELVSIDSKSGYEEGSNKIIDILPNGSVRSAGRFPLRTAKAEATPWSQRVTRTKIATTLFFVHTAIQCNLLETLQNTHSDLMDTKRMVLV